jgi:hypothetical protein
MYTQHFFHYFIVSFKIHETCYQSSSSSSPVIGYCDLRHDVQYIQYMYSWPNDVLPNKGIKDLTWCLLVLTGAGVGGGGVQPHPRPGQGQDEVRAPLILIQECIMKATFNLKFFDSVKKTVQNSSH